MGSLEVFYSEALRHFREVGGSDDEFKWFVGARLAWFGIYRDEVRLRLKRAPGGFAEGFSMLARARGSLHC